MSTNNVEAVSVACTSSTCTIAINNGTRYVYRSNRMSGYELKRTFDSIAIHSQGKALAWIKENANMIEKY